jgi:hypothetical protein
MEIAGDNTSYDEKCSSEGLLVITPTMERKPLLIVKSTEVKSYLFDSKD